MNTLNDDIIDDTFGVRLAEFARSPCIFSNAILYLPVAFNGQRASNDKLE